MRGFTQHLFMVMVAGKLCLQCCMNPYACPFVNAASAVVGARASAHAHHVRMASMRTGVCWTMHALTPTHTLLYLDAATLVLAAHSVHAAAAAAASATTPPQQVTLLLQLSDLHLSRFDQGNPGQVDTRAEDLEVWPCTDAIRISWKITAACYCIRHKSVQDYRTEYRNTGSMEVTLWE